MDWLKSVQKQAQEAAEKLMSSEAAATAISMAQQATQQAKAMAEQASEKAKEVAKEAMHEAEKSLTSLKGGQSSTSTDPLKYGITPELQQFVRNLQYSTFSDYPMDTLDIPTEPAAQRLTPWQETHALLVLKAVPQLQDLRFVLCPKWMDEFTFWSIYFTLCHRYLPPEDKRQQPTPPSALQQQQQQQQATQAAAAAAGSSAASSSSASRGLGGLGTAAAATIGAGSSTNPSVGEDLGGAATGAAAGDSRAVGSKEAAAAAAAPPSPAAAAGGAGGVAAAAVAGGAAAAAVAGGAAAAAVAGGAAAAGGGGDEAGNGGGGGAALNEKNLQQLEGLEDDPELDAYLQEALTLDDGAGGEEDVIGMGSDLDDLDDFMNELDDGQ